MQVGLSFFSGLLLGAFVLSNWVNHREATTTELRERGYSFINPLLECEVAADVIEGAELKPFRHKVHEVIDGKIEKGMAMHVSVYFRDLNNGPWFGINEEEEFSPASLLKVPIMIAFFKQVESNPSLLKKKVQYRGGYDANASADIRSQNMIEKGKSYTMEDLLYRMIVYSDNDAKDLLFDNLDTKLLDKTYLDLGLEIPGVRKPEDFMSVRAYASFFRILFNASYLSREMSETALGYLAETEFKAGLVAGVPHDIVVAHKFGERRILGNNIDVKQLHDCGIIYYPNYPYLLCIMTRGNDFNELSGVIRDISSVVYNEVEIQRRGK